MLRLKKSEKKMEKELQDKLNKAFVNILEVFHALDHELLEDFVICGDVNLNGIDRQFGIQLEIFDKINEIKRRAVENYYENEEKKPQPNRYVLKRKKKKNKYIFDTEYIEKAPLSSVCTALNIFDRQLKKERNNKQ